MIKWGQKSAMIKSKKKYIKENKNEIIKLKICGIYFLFYFWRLQVATTDLTTSCISFFNDHQTERVRGRSGLHDD